MTVNIESILSDFGRQFDGHKPTVIARAPGRVNLIGEHTDYNDGYVLPIAMHQCLYVAGRRREDRTLRVHSMVMSETAAWSIDDLGGPGEPKWANYSKGVAVMLQRQGITLSGADLMIVSQLPIGGGVSSSAALEVGTAKALLALVDEFVEPVQLALLCRQAEHEYANSPCGIMDQFACVLSHEGSALLLDCRSRQYDHIPFNPPGASLVVMDTQVKHEIGGGEYAKRQAECQAAVAHFKQHLPDIRALRDVHEIDLAQYGAGLDVTPLARARHIVTENHRVVRAAEALRASALHEFGQLMTESHASLRDDYSVSCEELDALVELACGIDGVYGARMTGGGFGGCAIALAEDGGVNALQRSIQDRYNGQFTAPAAVYTTRAGAGASAQHL
jgi:galactokinase